MGKCHGYVYLLPVLILFFHFVHIYLYFGNIYTIEPIPCWIQILFSLNQDAAVASPKVIFDTWRGLVPFWLPVLEVCIRYIMSTLTCDISPLYNSSSSYLRAPGAHKLFFTSSLYFNECQLSISSFTKSKYIFRALHIHDFFLSDPLLCMHVRICFYYYHVWEYGICRCVCIHVI